MRSLLVQATVQFDGDPPAEPRSVRPGMSPHTQDGSPKPTEHAPYDRVCRCSVDRPEGPRESHSVTPSYHRCASLTYLFGSKLIKEAIQRRADTAGSCTELRVLFGTEWYLVVLIVG